MKITTISIPIIAAIATFAFSQGMFAQTTYYSFPNEKNPVTAQEITNIYSDNT